MTHDERSEVTEPRAHTLEEMRTMLLDTVQSKVQFWAAEPNAPGYTLFQRLEGLAFSLLVMIDGGSELPAFQLIPDPHPADKQFNTDEGDNYWPEGVDIAGGLHELFAKKAP